MDGVKKIGEKKMQCFETAVWLPIMEVVENKRKSNRQASLLHGRKILQQQRDKETAKIEKIKAAVNTQLLSWTEGSKQK